jgi:hypothetical protein
MTGSNTCLWRTVMPVYKRWSCPCALTEHRAMKPYWGSGCIAPRIDLGTRWRWVVSFTPRPLYPQGKSPWYPLDRRVGGPQSRSGRGSEQKNSQPLPGNEPPIIQPLAQRYTTDLSRLQCMFVTNSNTCLTDSNNTCLWRTVNTSL